MEEELEVYECPEVLSFGDTDFEPMIFGCVSGVTCDTEVSCFAAFALPG